MMTVTGSPPSFLPENLGPLFSIFPTIVCALRVAVNNNSPLSQTSSIVESTIRKERKQELKKEVFTLNGPLALTMLGYSTSMNYVHKASNKNNKTKNFKTAMPAAKLSFHQHHVL